MSISRAEYFKDLLSDCEIAAQEFPYENRAILIAALVVSDSLNGLRKAILQTRFSYVDKD